MEDEIGTKDLDCGLIGAGRVGGDLMRLEDKLKTEHELMRRKLWCDAWVTVAGVPGPHHKDVATSWADEALKQFDERFNLTKKGE